MKESYTADEFVQIIECIDRDFPLIKIDYESDPYYAIFYPGESIIFTIKNGKYKILGTSLGVRKCLL